MYSVDRSLPSRPEDGLSVVGRRRHRGQLAAGAHEERAVAGKAAGAGVCGGGSAVPAVAGAHAASVVVIGQVWNAKEHSTVSLDTRSRKHVHMNLAL